MRLLHRYRGACAALLAACAVACSPSAPPPLTSSTDPPERPTVHAARSERAGDAERPRIPDVVGRTLAGAEVDLASLGATVRVMAFDDEGGVITGMHPSGGASLPHDGVVDLYLGAPPEVDGQPVVRAAAAAPPEVVVPDPPDLPAEGAGPEPAADGEDPVTAPPPTPPPSSPAPPPSSGPAPPDRVNPQRMPPMDPGTLLAGPASWYGPGFEGNTTACGGTFDSSALTLASRELRCGTVVRISGPTGTVEAVATDWGPAEWTNRRFDLSRATFAAVAPIGAGVTDVTVEVLTPGP